MIGQNSQMQGAGNQFADAQASVGMPWRILTFSFFIFMVSVLAAVGLSLGYEKYLDSKIANVDSRIKSLTASVEQRQQEYVSFYSQVANLKSILEKRSFTANIFTFLEKNTINQVYFSEADMDMKKGELKINGLATTLNDISQQIAVMENDKKNIKGIILNEVSFQDGKVNFSLSITFSESFFKKPLVS